MSSESADAYGAILPDMPEQQYRSAPEVNKHLLDALATGTPAHVKELRDHPKPPTDAMKLGTLIHKAILEPSSLSSLYHTYPDGFDGRTKEGKMWKEAATAKADIPFLQKEEHRSIIGMIHAVYANPNAARLIEDSAHEVSWFAELGGVRCKGRVDGMSDEWSTLFDLKSAGPGRCCAEVFQRDVANYRYHVQDAFYRDGVAALTHKEWAFVFIVVEKVPPHAVRLFVLDAPWVELGRELYERELEVYKQCVETDTWPAYPADFYTLTMPRWARKGQATIEDLNLAPMIEDAQ